MDEPEPANSRTFFEYEESNFFTGGIYVGPFMVAWTVSKEITLMRENFLIKPEIFCVAEVSKPEPYL